MDLIVSAAGIARFGKLECRCALGRGGVRVDKREGDGTTPAGHFALTEVFYRPDRRAAPSTALSVTALSETDGWCDDPTHPDYNRRVRLPHPARHERMWRDDGLYDAVAVTDHNSNPVVPGAGSGIFVHVAGGPDYPPTEGCVAFAMGDLLEILAGWDGGQVVILAPGG